MEQQGQQTALVRHRWLVARPPRGAPVWREAQAAAANPVRGELVKIAAALEALAGQAVPS